MFKVRPLTKKISRIVEPYNPVGRHQRALKWEISESANPAANLTKTLIEYHSDNGLDTNNRLKKNTSGIAKSKGNQAEQYVDFADAELMHLTVALMSKTQATNVPAIKDPLSSLTTLSDLEKTYRVLADFMTDPVSTDINRLQEIVSSNFGFPADHNIDPIKLAENIVLFEIGELKTHVGSKITERKKRDYLSKQCSFAANQLFARAIAETALGNLEMANQCLQAHAQLVSHAHNAKLELGNNIQINHRFALPRTIKATELMLAQNHFLRQAVIEANSGIPLDNHLIQNNAFALQTLGLDKLNFMSNARHNRLVYLMAVAPRDAILDITRSPSYSRTQTTGPKKVGIDTNTNITLLPYKEQETASNQIDALNEQIIAFHETRTSELDGEISTLENAQIKLHKKVGRFLNNHTPVLGKGKLKGLRAQKQNSQSTLQQFQKANSEYHITVTGSPETDPEPPPVTPSVSPRSSSSKSKPSKPKKTKEEEKGKFPWLWVGGGGGLIAAIAGIFAINKLTTPPPLQLSGSAGNQGLTSASAQS